jgi:hypothetical protein
MAISMAIFIRPHYLLDIIRDYGYGIRYQPHEYGYALHLVAEDVLHNRKRIGVIGGEELGIKCMRVWRSRTAKEYFSEHRKTDLAVAR